MPNKCWLESRNILTFSPVAGFISAIFDVTKKKKKKRNSIFILPKDINIARSRTLTTCLRFPTCPFHPSIFLSFFFPLPSAPLFLPCFSYFYIDSQQIPVSIAMRFFFSFSNIMWLKMRTLLLEQALS